MPEEKKNCFVITPIGGDGSAIRRHIDGIIQAAIVPVLEPEYKVVVAHKISEPGSITKQVIKHIYSDALVITNLTEKNPNVMYELAFRHSLGKPVIMIAEKGTNLPSDIIMERTIFYQNDASGVLELREELEKALKERQLDSIAVNSIRKMPQKDYQLFKARVIKNSLNLADNFFQPSVQVVRIHTLFHSCTSMSTGYWFHSRPDQRVCQLSSS